MSSKSLAFRLVGGTYDESRLADACTDALRATAKDFLNPPITNMGFRGIAKTGALMRTWANSLDDPATTMHQIGTSMEHGGTGGGFFRRLWAEYLEEGAAVTGNGELSKLAARYSEIAERWTEVADLLRGVEGDEDVPSVLERTASLVDGLANEEHDAARDLQEAVN